MTGILIGVLLTTHVIVSVLLLLIILMQRPRSEGLGTAFGGNVADTLFGSGAGNVLTKITAWLATIFFVTTITLAYLYSHRDTSSSLSKKLAGKPVAESTLTATNKPPITSAPPLPVVTNLTTTPLPMTSTNQVDLKPITKPSPKNTSSNKVDKKSTDTVK